MRDGAHAARKCGRLPCAAHLVVDERLADVAPRGDGAVLEEIGEDEEEEDQRGDRDPE